MLPVCPKLETKLLFLLLFVSQVSWVQDCTMRTAPIDFKRLNRDPSIKSYVVDTNRHALTGLLKNGQSFRLIHEGCMHSGAEAALWLPSSTRGTERESEWIQEAVKFARVAFFPDIARDIEGSIKLGKLHIDMKSEARLVLTASPSGFFTYTIIVVPSEQGMMMKITYILG